MLIVSRKKNESIIIQNNIEVIVLDMQGDKVRIGIDAPGDIRIMRKELLETEAFNREAVKIPNKTDLRRLKDMLKGMSAALERESTPESEDSIDTIT